MRLYLIASKPTDSVIFGFLPAAARMGLDVVLLTDQPAAHEHARAAARLLPRPGCTPDGDGHRADTAIRMLECDVWDFRELIRAIAALPPPDAVFSNSDRLQTQTALAAEYFDVPGKDWRSAARAKDKSLMRRRLAETGIERVAATEIRIGTPHPVPGLAYPVVLKPSEGVASEDVVLVHDSDELAERSAEIFARRPDETLLAEEYLTGELRTLETLGDGVTTWVLGGFRTRISPPPFFVEERLTWDPPPEVAEKHVLRALSDIGTGFGACHTEYVLDEVQGPRLIEVNDRLIGDHCDFVLGDLLGVDLFELVLRLHLGGRLPAGGPPAPRAGRGHAVIDYLVADRAGVLVSAPSAGAPGGTEPGVTLTNWPLRQPGDRIAFTHTNRDYLGVISVIGPDAVTVERSAAAARTGGGWEITP